MSGHFRTAAVALVAAVALLANGPASAQAQAPAVPVPLPTPAEEADYLSFTAPGEVGPYLGRLAAEGEGVTVDSLQAPTPIPIIRIAPTPDDRDEPGGDEPGGHEPAPAPDPDVPVVRVLLVGAQHGTERAGVEVALRIARDLATGRLASLRRGLEVRIVPMANPWGVANRRTETADGVDMNADHVHLAAPETRALWAEYAAWRPHLVLDLHEIGPSEYTVQVGVPTHPNAPGAAMFARFYLLPFVANELAGSDVRYHEYVAEWSGGRPVEGAASPSSDPDADGAGDAGVQFTPPPLDPASARNAFALAGSVAYFVAVSSSRDIIGLEERTERLYIAVRALLAGAAGLAPDLVAAGVAAARLPKGALALQPRYVAKSPDASLPWIFTNPRGQRESGRLAPWRSEVAVDLDLEAPGGWWLHSDQVDLADALRRHGFEVSAGGDGGPAAATLLAYPRCVPDPTGGDADASRFLRPVASSPPEGALWVSADQPGGRLLFTLLEPWSTGGWFAREFYDFGDPGDDESRDQTGACDEGATFPVVRVPR
ncbi:MAG: hypothetical protein ACODAB_02220 [Gemmatimonadota bacterium]